MFAKFSMHGIFDTLQVCIRRSTEFASEFERVSRVVHGGRRDTDNPLRDNPTPENWGYTVKISL